jgi:hypothetical protein
MKRLAVILAAASVLGGCELVLLEGATMVGSDKSLADRIVSWSSNKDCSGYRRATGRTYCKEDDIQPTPQVHCYRTIGEVTCYEQPEASGRPEVGRNDHNYDETGTRR